MEVRYTPLIRESLEAVGLVLVEDYIVKSHNMDRQYIVTWAILDICIGMDIMVVLRTPMRWW